jgi:hypothetical protein
MLTPNQMHLQNKLIMKTYKTKNSIKNVFDAVLFIYFCLIICIDYLGLVIIEIKIPSC